MRRKLALLTLQHINHGKGMYHPDNSQLELGIYEVKEPRIVPEGLANGVEGRMSVEGRIGMQLQDSQVLASKTFEDDRGSNKIANELAMRYNGEVTSGVGGVCWIATFRTTSADRIIHDYFLSR